MLRLSPDLTLKESTGICPRDRWQSFSFAESFSIIFFYVYLTLIKHVVKGNLKTYKGRISILNLLPSLENSLLNQYFNAVLFH